MAHYLRGAGEWGRYPTILTEGPKPGLGYMAWQVAEPDQVEGWARRLKDAGVEHNCETGGSSFAQGDIVSFTGPFGHRTELFYDFAVSSPARGRRRLDAPGSGGGPSPWWRRASCRRAVFAAADTTASPTTPTLSMAGSEPRPSVGGHDRPPGARRPARPVVSVA